jgi:putative resolvase
MPPFLRISDAARFLGVCAKTLRRWDAAHRVTPAFRTVGAHRRYDLAILKTLRTPSAGTLPPTSLPPAPIRAITYARVSSSYQKQHGDLQRQVEELPRFCSRHQWQIVRQIQDVGSGVNDAREGLHQLIHAVSRGRCDAVVVAYPDRLARFGINVLWACFNEWGTSLCVVNEHPLGTAPESALITDITAILYSYMGKIPDVRSAIGTFDLDSFQI